MTERTTLDPDELAKFEALASLWWDRSGPFWPLHRLNPLRSAYIAQIVTSRHGLPIGADKPLAGLSVLDIGCGGGILSETIAAYGARVYGVDVVRRNVDIARLHGNSSGYDLSYELASAEVLALRGDQFDVVLNMEVVEHVAELSLFMDACAKLVKPGGIMFVATINRTLVSWLSAILGAEYILRWLPRGTHRWSKFPTDIEMENHLTQRGLRVFERTGVLANPITRQFRLSSYRGINYMLAAQKDPPSETLASRSSPAA